MSRDPYRHFAADARAGTFARRKAREDQRNYVRKNWRWLLGGYAMVLAIALVPMPFFGGPFSHGLMLGLALAGGAGALANMIVIQTGTGPTMAGELAEQWTAQELRPLQDHGYRLANHVSIDRRGDADHILVGPGGLFVLETKWSASEWKEDRFFADPLAQVEKKARNTWLQVKGHGVANAVPVLVLWGQAAKEINAGPGVRRKGETYVVAGPHLKRWLLGRQRGALTGEQVAAVFEQVCAIADRADKVEAPVPPSVGALYARALSALTLAVSACMAPLLLVRFGFVTYAVSACVLAMVGWGLLVRGRRLPGWAVLIGSTGALGVGAVALLTALTRRQGP